MNPIADSGSLPPTRPAAAGHTGMPSTLYRPIAQGQQIGQPFVRQKSNGLVKWLGLFIGLSLLIMLAYAAACWSTGLTSTSLSTPSATARAFHAAFKNKDVVAWKKTLNAGYLKTAAETANQKNLSLDAYLKQIIDQGSPYSAGEIEEIRNEKILGDRATLDIKINGQWLKWDFVKEQGEWKSL
jgi:hypothetical protein